MSTSNSKNKKILTVPPVLMLIHKDEIHKGALRNFLSLIYHTGHFLFGEEKYVIGSNHKACEYYVYPDPKTMMAA